MNSEMLKKLPEVAKAVGAFMVGLSAFAGVVIPLVSDGNVSPLDAVAIMAAFGGWIGGTYTVYQVPNKPQS